MLTSSCADTQESPLDAPESQQQDLGASYLKKVPITTIFYGESVRICSGRGGPCGAEYGIATVDTSLNGTIAAANANPADTFGAFDPQISKGQLKLHILDKLEGRATLSLLEPLEMKPEIAAYYGYQSVALLPGTYEIAPGGKVGELKSTGVVVFNVAAE